MSVIRVDKVLNPVVPRKQQILNAIHVLTSRGDWHPDTCFEFRRHPKKGEEWIAILHPSTTEIIGWVDPSELLAAVSLPLLLGKE